jgi:general secretion pathway protein A
MHWKHFGLQRSPFAGPRSIDFYFEGPGQKEGLARLQFVCDEARRGALVTGVPGVGKSALLECFRRRLNSSSERDMAFVSCPAFGSRELLYDLAQQLALGPECTSSEAELWRLLHQHITANRIQGVQTILILDRAELLLERSDGLHALHALFQLDVHPSANFTVILAARPDVVRRARRELVEWVDLAVIVEPFSLEETIAYVDHQLRAAGATGALFDRPAIEAVYQCTQGIARHINRLCDLALLTAAGEGKSCVDVSCVQAMAEEVTLEAALNLAGAHAKSKERSEVDTLPLADSISALGSVPNIA